VHVVALGAQARSGLEMLYGIVQLSAIHQNFPHRILRVGVVGMRSDHLIK